MAKKEQKEKPYGLQLTERYQREIEEERKYALRQKEPEKKPKKEPEEIVTFEGGETAYERYLASGYVGSYAEWADEQARSR